MSWHKLPPEIHVIIFRKLAVLSDFYRQWMSSTRYREYEYFAHSSTLPASWWEEYGQNFLVSRSFWASFQNAIVEVNNPNLIIKCTNEALALEAIQREVRKGKSPVRPLNTEERYPEPAYLYELLKLAASREFSSCMELLLGLGADPDRSDIYSNLLCECSRRGRPKAVGLLIKYGANLEVEGVNNSEENTPFGWAVYSGQYEIADILLKAGANRNVVVDWYHGPTAALYFGKNCGPNKAQMVDVFRANGVDIDAIADIPSSEEE